MEIGFDLATFAISTILWNKPVIASTFINVSTLRIYWQNKSRNTIDYPRNSFSNVKIITVSTCTKRNCMIIAKKKEIVCSCDQIGLIKSERLSQCKSLSLLNSSIHHIFVRIWSHLVVRRYTVFDIHDNEFLKSHFFRSFIRSTNTKWFIPRSYNWMIF